MIVYIILTIWQQQFVDYRSIRSKLLHERINEKLHFQWDLINTPDGSCIDQHVFSSIIHFQLIDDCEIREFETYELNSALIQYRVQGTITIHATASLIYAERIISRVIRGWHGVNRRRVPSIIHRRASVTRMGLGSFVLSISLEHSCKNADLLSDKLVPSIPW